MNSTAMGGSFSTISLPRQFFFQKAKLFFIMLLCVTLDTLLPDLFKTEVKLHIIRTVCSNTKIILNG